MMIKLVYSPHNLVAPARERGLKFILWYTTYKASGVAPARERGLKSWPQKGPAVDLRRSRKGAWIEILLSTATELLTPSLPQGSVD